MTTALRLTGLKKDFPIGKRLFGPPRAVVHAVQPVTLEVAKGETLGIVGESGCGKSTLARMLVGLLEPSDGTIEIEGKALDNTYPAEFGKLIQYVFQDPQSSLNPCKTIRQVMEAPLKRLDGMARTERDARISEIFASGSLCEAMRVLEAQGLIKTRTGKLCSRSQPTTRQGLAGELFLFQGPDNRRHLPVAPDARTRTGRSSGRAVIPRGT